MELIFTLKNYLLVALGLGLAIFVHEFGHFLLAKLAGVKVERFSIGFGRALIKWTRGETQYVLAAIPLGGYVQMLGQSDFGSDQKADDARSYARKTPGQRALIIVAGVIMNAILAVILFSVVFTIGKNFIAPDVGFVQPGSPAETAGIRAGDRITRIDDCANPDFEDVMVYTIMTGDGKPLSLEVQGPEGTRSIVARPKLTPPSPLPTLGIMPATSLEVGAVDDSAARRGVNLKVGDVIEAIDGKKLSGWGDLLKEMVYGDARPVTLTILRKGKQIEAPYTPLKIRRQRIGVLSAGPCKLAMVSDGMPAAEAGLKVGDVILDVDGKPIKSYYDLQTAVAAREGAPIEIRYSRDGKEAAVEVKPVYVPLYDPGDTSPIRWRIGVAPEFPLTVGEVQKDSGAEKAGLAPGDRITGLDFLKKTDGDYRSVRSWQSAKKGRSRSQLRSMSDLEGLVSAILSEEPPGKIRLHWVDPKGAAREAIVETEPFGEPFGQYELAMKQQTVLRRASPLEAIGLGMRKTWLFLRLSEVTVRRLLSGALKVGEGTVTGPVGIGVIGSKIAAEGLTHLIYFFAMINISLAFFNLLPMAPLDGGHLVFLAIEKVRGKPVSDKIIRAVFITGWVLILSFVLYVTFFDVTKFIL